MDQNKSDQNTLIFASAHIHGLEMQLINETPSNTKGLHHKIYTCYIYIE